MKSSRTPEGDDAMKSWIAALGVCAPLSIVPMGAFAHGGYYYYPGNAALGGFGGGVVGGLIGSSIYTYRVNDAPAPVVVAPAAPVVVAPSYTPAPVVVEPYGARPGYYYSYGRYYPYHHHRHWDDD
jgi:hypothetical protein